MADLNATLAERGARYGNFRDHAELVEGFLRVMESASSWANMDAVKRQALRTIFDKLARIGNGDPEYHDNWHDLAGYSTLVERDLLDPTTPSGEFIKTSIPDMTKAAQAVADMIPDAVRKPTLKLPERI